MRTTEFHCATVGFYGNRLTTETAKAISGRVLSMQYIRDLTAR